MIFCRDLRQKYKHPKLQNRRLVYYCGMEPDHITNTALCLGAYLMLEHGFSPKEALHPFRQLPVYGHRDATWAEPTFVLHAISCLEGLRKALDLGLITRSPASFIDDFDCDLYDACDDPAILNLNQVC